MASIILCMYNVIIFCFWFFSCNNIDTGYLSERLIEVVTIFFLNYRIKWAYIGYCEACQIYIASFFNIAFFVHFLIFITNSFLNNKYQFFKQIMMATKQR